MGILMILAAVINAFITVLNVGNIIVIMFGGIFVIFGTIWNKMSKTVPAYCFKGIILFIIVFFAAMIIFIFANSKLNAPDFSEDSIIILGCGLKGREPSRALIKRLDKAIEYYNKNNKAIIVVTGGQGPTEKCSEAEAMAEYLIENGISEQRIIKEDKSTSTNENFKFSKALLDEYFNTDYTTVCITNTFHAYRASKLAQLNGLSVKSFNASTPVSSAAMCYLREVLAVVQLWVFKR